MTRPRSAAVLGLSVSTALCLLILLEWSGGMSGSVQDLFGASWGRVTLFDLYLGLTVVGAWVWHRESGRFTRAAWLGAFAVLGNIAVGLYLVRAGRSDTWTEFFHGESGSDR